MEMVRVAVPAELPAIFSGLVAPKLNVGGYTAPVGLEVTTAVRTTTPAKPPDGVTVMVELFPVVAPGVTLTAEPLTAIPGGTVTTIGTVPVFALSFASPV